MIINVTGKSTATSEAHLNCYFFDCALSSRLCAGASPAAEGRGRSPAARCGLLVAVASSVAETYFTEVCIYVLSLSVVNS